MSKPDEHAVMFEGKRIVSLAYSLAFGGEPHPDCLRALLAPTIRQVRGNRPQDGVLSQNDLAFMLSGFMAAANDLMQQRFKDIMEIPF